jgi:hypothetical protein
MKVCVGPCLSVVSGCCANEPVMPVQRWLSWPRSNVGRSLGRRAGPAVPASGTGVRIPLDSLVAAPHSPKNEICPPFARPLVLSGFDSRTGHPWRTHMVTGHLPITAWITGRFLFIRIAGPVVRRIFKHVLDALFLPSRQQHIVPAPLLYSTGTVDWFVRELQ